MFKKIGFILSLSAVLALPVYAHLTGAFANFLAIVYDDSTISKLHEEVEQTKLEIEQLQPLVEQSEQDFKEEQQGAIEQLQFYSEMGLDTYLALMQQGTDVVDILGNQWLLNEKINDYLQQLNILYVTYQKLLQSQNRLKGHEQLLYAIEKNLQAREDFLVETQGMELENIANYLDIDWTAEVEENIIRDFQLDAELVNIQLSDWIEKSVDGAYQLSEQWLNEHSKARYYFRSDHVYVEYELEYAHVLVLGQVLQNAEGTAAQLVVEAGFYNGFYLPEELLVELPSFSIDYATLQTLEGIDSPYVIQQDGNLQIATK
ncbi:hypothetical protein NSQ62_12115 [Solibacillus sp. FSL H8-0523]|uniref:hypothetical protein n=1 Tax=Solibacillus sp. FSL H8-0523 TaxID=2954511 RepID=UPI003101A600